MNIPFDNINIDIQTGLTDEQVQAQRRKYGKNLLSPPPRTPWWKQLLEKFTDPTIVILLVSAAISLAMTAIEKYALGNPDVHFTESIGIFIAVFLAITVGYFSERKSEGEFEALNKVKDDIAVKVLRNGQITTISIADVVAGDLVLLDLGDKIPADGVLVDGMGLLIDQSLLTGESAPVKKVACHNLQVTSTELRKLCDESSTLFRGTMVNDGHGLMIAVKVGDSTEMGKIAANLADDESKSVTPLVEKLSRLAKQISVLGVTGALAIFTCMSVETIVQSTLLESFVDKTQYEWILAGIAVVLGFVLMKCVLKPFFASMDMALKGWFFQALASIPMMVFVYAVGVSAWGFYGDGDALAMNLLQQILNAFVVAVTIIVVAVPEGLPMMVTVSLAMNMLKMARQNCLVRKLVASETIGCATIICSDKTGTLTQNKMQPVWFWANGEESCELRVASCENAKRSSEGIDSINTTPHSSLLTPHSSSIWSDIVRSVCINSEANLEKSTDADGKTVVHRIGNPTECALLAMFDEQGFDYQAIRNSVERVGEMNHNSQRKMSMVLIRTVRSEEGGGRRDAKRSSECIDSNNTTPHSSLLTPNLTPTPQSLVCHIKGAPERILDKCSLVRIGDEIVPIDKYRDGINQALESASERALRVLAIAYKESCPTCFDVEKMDACLACPSYVLLGLVGIEDPVRAEVPPAVERCQQAGVKVKMITGDAKPTAIAIAKGCGILSQSYKENTSDGELVLTSDELVAVTDEDLPDVAMRLKVLARSTPMDKLRLVKALHYQGEVVAMTGDGTNDAPALKFADVGLSMGVSGTEVAKEASDIVLVDDNFKSIVTGIWWGRTLYQNIQRFLQFQLSVNFVALTCALIGPLVGIALPLTVTQLLWINIIMDTFAAIAYSTDPPREFSMHRKPVSRQAHIIMPSMWITILCNSLYQVIMLACVLYFGWFLESDQEKFLLGCDMTNPEMITKYLPALTVFFTTFVMFQFWHKFNCRALFHNENPFTLITKNRLFIGVILLITVSQIVMVQCSEYFSIGQIFRTTTLTFKQWLEIAGFTATALPVAWIIHQLAFILGAEKK